MPGDQPGGGMGTLGFDSYITSHSSLQSWYSLLLQINLFELGVYMMETRTLFTRTIEVQIVQKPKNNKPRLVLIKKKTKRVSHI